MASEITLTPATPGVATGVNTASVVTPIFAYTIPAKQVATLYSGALLVMDLRDAANAALPAATTVFVAGARPGMRKSREIDVKSYLAWANLTLAQQYDDTQNRLIRVSIDGGSVSFLEQHTLLIEVDSTAVVSWANSTLELKIRQEPYRDRG